MYRKTYIEVNESNLESNVKILLNNYPDYKYYFGVVKGNVYGYGYSSVKCLIKSGINYIAVSTLEEALCVRNEDKDIPILCLQPIHLEDIPDAIKNNITITISNFEYFKQFLTLNFNQKIKVHIKINSGFNRLGIADKNEVLSIYNSLKENTFVEVEGIFSHFATTGIYDKYWDNQLSRFIELTSLINIKEISIIHFGRSLTLLNHGKIDFCNGVRIGVVMYGYNHTPKKQKGLKGFVKNLVKKYNFKMQNISPTFTVSESLFKPSLSFYSEITEIRHVKKGQFVGYGAVFKAHNDSIIGFLSAGYADGFLKSNVNGDVAIHNKRYKIIAVDMGIITVLIDESVKVYDKVELIGENIKAIEVARRNNTTVYEILSLIKESIPRVNNRL